MHLASNILHLAIAAATVLFVSASPKSERLLDIVTEASTSTIFHSNPSFFADGAFNHRPFRSGAYGFKFRTTAVEIAENADDGAGQMSWVDIALCCASTPRTSGNVERDRPHEDAIAPAPADRCLTYEELTSDPPLTYRESVEPKGMPKSPCRASNPAFYRDEHHTHRARHESCCEYFSAFVTEAKEEFEDSASQDMLRSLAEMDAASVYQKAQLFTHAFDAWRNHVCRQNDGAPTGACCADCRQPDKNKLRRFSEQHVHGGCDFYGEGWCARGNSSRGLGMEMISSQNAALLADGAFNHRPTTVVPGRVDGRGVRHGGLRYVVRSDELLAFDIPDHVGGSTGQQSWVDIARCCAAAPSNSSVPEVDQPKARAVAGAPSTECISPSQLRDLAAGGVHVSPCRAHNAGFTKAEDGTWVAKHGACCDYMQEFIRHAPSEFTDGRSQMALSLVEQQPTVFEKSRQLVKLFHRFSREVCRKADTREGKGGPTGRCCVDCVMRHRNKKAKFASVSACGDPDTGYCTRDQLRAANATAEARALSGREIAVATAMQHLSDPSAYSSERAQAQATSTPVLPPTAPVSPPPTTSDDVLTTSGPDASLPAIAQALRTLLAQQQQQQQPQQQPRLGAGLPASMQSPPAWSHSGESLAAQQAELREWQQQLQMEEMHTQMRHLEEQQRQQQQMLRLRQQRMAPVSGALPREDAQLSSLESERAAIAKALEALKASKS